MREMQAPLESGGEMLSDLAGSADGLSTVDAELLFTGEFTRVGHDLQLTGSDGASLTIEDYFATDAPVALVSPQGAMLTGDVVQALSGGATVQLAQSGAVASDAQLTEAGTEIGHIESLEGLAQVKRGGSLIDLEVGDPVYQNDVLTTGGGSALGIVFVDNTVFAMAANGRMILDSLIYNPDASDNSLLVNLVHGSFVFVSGEIAPTGGMTVETPVASIGIRGTMVSLSIKAINGETEGSLLEDPDGELGSYGIYDKLTGELIGLLDATGSLWTLTSVTSTLRYHDKTQFDYVSEADLVNFATTLHYSPRENRPGANTRPLQLRQRSSLDGDDVLETAAGPGSFGSSGSSYEATNDYQNSAQSLLSEPAGSGISGFAAAPTLDSETQSASVPTPVPAAAFASFSSSPPPPLPPAPAPSAQPNSPPTALTLDNASVDEGSEGAVVGTLTVADPDSGESFTYAVSDDRFEVANSQLRLRGGGALDYETEPVVPLTVAVTDSAGNTFTQDFEIAVNDRADAPVVDLNGPEPGSDSAASFAEGEGPVAIVDAGAGISDDDSANLAAVTATITNPVDGAAESLAVSTAGTAVTADYNSASGVLTLTGGTSLAEYQQVLSTLTYQNTAENPTAGVRTIEVLAEDTDGLTSTVVTASVTVAAENDPPVLMNNSLTIEEGESVVLTGANLSTADPDDTDFTYTVSDIQAGQFELQSAPDVAITSFTQAQLDAGQVLFVHDGSNQSPAYQVTVSDGDLSDSGAAAIAFSTETDAPVLVNNQLSLSEGGSVILTPADLSATDADGGEADLVFTVSGVQSGLFERLSAPGTAIATFTQAEVAAGDIRFVHDGGEAAPAYEVTVSDGELSDSGAATIAFTPENDPPVLVTNNLSLAEGESVVLSDANLSTTDPDDTDFTYAVSGVQAGQFELLSDPGVVIASFTQAQLDAGQVLFAHDGSETAPSYLISVSDGESATDPSVAEVTFTSMNEAPVVDLNGVEAGIDHSAVFVAGEGPVGVVDPDTSVGDADSPTLAGITITLTNAVDGDAEQLEVSLEAAGALGIAVSGNGTTSLALSGAVSPADYQELLYTLTYDNSVAEPTAGIRTIEIQADDGGASNNLSLVAVASISVTAVGAQPPVLAANQMTIDEGGTAVLSAAELAATDPDSDEAGLLFTIGGVTGGQFELVANPGIAITSFTQAEVTAGEVRFVHDGGEAAPAYQVAVSDGEATSDPAQATIAFTPLNDSPGALDDAVTTDEDTAVLANVLADNGSGIDSDPEGDTLAVSAVNGMAADVGSQMALASGALLTLNADGSFSYDPNGQFESLGEGDNAEDSFTYTLSDGNGGEDSATVTITIVGANDAPLAADDAVSTNEASVLAGDVLVDNGNGPDSDVEGDVLTIVAVNGTAASVGQQIALASGALLTLNADGTFSYDSNGQFDSLGGGESAEDSFAYTLSDGNGGEDTATVTVTVNGLAAENVPPVAEDDAFTTNESTNLGGNLLADNGNGADSDADGDLLTVSAVNGIPANVSSQIALVSGALLTLNADGTFSYDPNGQFESLSGGDSAEDSFTYTISDDNGGEDTATAVISINGVNDAPEVASDTAVVVKGAALAITPAILSASDAEASDPGLITFTVSNQVAGTVLRSGQAAASFTLADIEAGLVTFQHDDSGGAEAGFTVVASDSDGGDSAPVALNFTVSAGFVWTNGAGDGDWHNPANWASNSVPGDGAAVVIEDQTGEVTYSTDTTALSSLTLAGEALNVIGGTLAVTDLTWTGGALAGAGGTMIVGGAATLSGPATLDLELVLNGTGELDGNLSGSGQMVNGGSLLVAGTASLAVAFANAAEAELVIDGGATGAASLTISGAFAQQGIVTLTSNGSSGAASLIVTGAPLTNDGAIVVEPGAGGVRSIEADLVNNGEMTFNAVTAITGVGGAASNEAGAVLTANADVTVTGAASFRNSGTMTVAVAATFALVAADFENATGGVIGGGGTIDVDGSFTNNGTINPGTSPGALAIDGNFVQGAGGQLMVEIDGSGSDLLTVTGTATFAGTVTITLLNGYTPTAGETFTFVTAGSIIDEGVTVMGHTYAGGQFGVQLSGGTARLVAVGSDGDVFIGPDEIIVGDTDVGSLTVDAGQVLATQYFSVGEAATGSGTFALTNGSQLTVEGASYIGNFGEGQATISGGAQATFISDDFDNLVVAGQPGSSGSLVIDGQGTVVTTAGLDNTVQIGRDGDGTMTVQGGAALNTLSLAAGHSGQGTITIQGEGTVVTASNDDGRFSGVFDYEAGFVRAGRNDGSNGSISVLDGANLMIRNGIGVNEDAAEPELQLARDAGSTGFVLVDGPGSVIEISQSAPPDPINGIEGPILQVGHGGAGNMTVQNAGQVNLLGDRSGIWVGDLATADGSLTVTGPGSAVSLVGDDAFLLIGDDGAGGVSLASGGRIDFLGDRAGLQVGVVATGSGTLTVDGEQSSITMAGVDPFASIGRLGQGTVVLRNGASMQLTGPGGYFEVGRENGALGTLAIESGSALEIYGGEGDSLLRIGRFSGSNGTVEVEGGGSQLIVGGTNSDNSFGNRIDVGSEGFGQLTALDGAAVVAEQLRLGVSTSGVGVGLVDDASWEIGPGGLRVGLGADGSLTVQNGGSLAVAAGVGNGVLSVGDEASGTGSLVFTSGAQLAVEGATNIGRFGAGEATINGGSSALFQSDNFDNLLIAAQAGSTGSLVISGAGTTVTTAGFDNTVQAGMLGTGTLLVEDGASLATLFLEAGREGQGTVTIQGAGTEVVASSDTGRFSGASDFMAGFVRVGRDAGSVGTVQVLDGARLQIRNGSGVNEDTAEPGLQLGWDPGSSGSVLISGAGSIVEITQTSPSDPVSDIHGPFVQIGRGGAGGMTVSNGGQLMLSAGEVSFALGRLATGDGTLLVDGVGSAVMLSASDVFATVGDEGTGEVILNNGGSFSLFGDGSNFNQMIVGHDAGSFGSFLIQSGSQLTIEADDGDTRLRIGRFAGSEGHVVVEGVGSLLTVGDSGALNPAINRLEVGYFGTGAIETLDSGKVVAGRMDMGFDVGGSGTALIDDASWEIASSMRVGRVGSGSLTIQNDSLVDVGSGFSSIADAGGSSGIVNVHATSSLSYAGFLSVGNGAYDPDPVDGYGQDATAFGTLNILGGTATAQNANVGGALRGNGTVLIDGAGALFDVANVLTIAFEGTGVVTVGNGGTLEAGAAQDDGITDIFIGSGGSLTIENGGTVLGDIENNGGTLINGNSPGTADFGGDFVMTGGALEVEFAGTGAGAFDLYQVAGEAALQGGILEFSIIDDYQPLIGDSFAFFAADGGLLIDEDMISFVIQGVSEDFDFEVLFTANTAEFSVLGGGAGGSTIFVGGASDNVFDGGAGNDRLDGGGGQDSLIGGVGADVFVLRAADATESLDFADLISDFEVGTDSFGFADGLAVEDLAITATASGDAALVLQSSGAALAVLQGVSAADLNLEELTAMV